MFDLGFSVGFETVKAASHVVQEFEDTKGKRPTRVNIPRHMIDGASLLTKDGFIGSIFGIDAYICGDKLEAKYHHPRGLYF